MTWKNAVSAKEKCCTAKIEKITRIISDISQNKPDTENRINLVNKRLCVELAMSKQRKQKRKQK